MIWMWRWRDWRKGWSTFHTTDEHSAITCIYFSGLSICWRPYYDRDL